MRYLQELTEFYDAFWRNKPLLNLGHKKASAEFSNLTLLADEVLEESFAINGMVEKGGNLFCKKLHALGKCFMALLGNPEEVIKTKSCRSLNEFCQFFAVIPSEPGLEMNFVLSY